MQAIELKTMVIGPRVGKTKWIRSLFEICSLREFSPTIGVNVTPYDFGYISKNRYRLNFWEIGSKYQGLAKNYCTNSDLAIIFMDSKEEYKKYEKWVSHIPKIYVEKKNQNNIIQKIRLIIQKQQKQKSKL